MSEMRTFTKTDWHGFSGTEEAPGKPPMIREGKDWIGVSDVTGIEVHIVNDNDDLGIGDWSFYLNLPIYSVCVWILSMLPEDLTRDKFIEVLKTIGFKEA